MIKNNPYHLLKKAGIKPELLDKDSKRALKAFDDTLKDVEADPDAGELKTMAEDLGAQVCDIIEENIQRIKDDALESESKAEGHTLRKHQSKKTIEKTQRTFDELEMCRQRLRDERKRKLESGEIQKPKKKTLATKLRLDLVKIVLLIPSKLKDDVDVITKTRKAILKFLNELKGIWGLDRIKPIEEELNKRFEKLEDEAERLATNN